MIPTWINRFFSGGGPGPTPSASADFSKASNSGYVALLMEDI